jgi:hypothetical protein
MKKLEAIIFSNKYYFHNTQLILYTLECLQDLNLKILMETLYNQYTRKHGKLNLVVPVLIKGHDCKHYM